MSITHRNRPRINGRPWARNAPAAGAVVANERQGGLGPEQSLRPIQFKRFRNKAGDDGGRRLSGAFRITFARPIEGPLALGHSCHFGLGLFVPGKEEERPCIR